MCYFVMVASCSRGASEFSCFRDAGFSVRIVAHPWVRSVFGAGCVVAAVTKGGCSCDLFGGGSAAPDEVVLRRKYERKGWSASKIARALASKLEMPSARERAVDRQRFWETAAGFVREGNDASVFACTIDGDIEDHEIEAPVPVVEVAVGECLEARWDWPLGTRIELRI